MFMAILDGRQDLEERIANLVFLGAIMVGSDSREEIAAAVKIENEKISCETTMDAVVSEVKVGIQGDCMSDVFMSLYVLLCVKLLG